MFIEKENIIIYFNNRPFNEKPRKIHLNYFYLIFIGQ